MILKEIYSILESQQQILNIVDSNIADMISAIESSEVQEWLDNYQWVLSYDKPDIAIGKASKHGTEIFFGVNYLGTDLSSYEDDRTGPNGQEVTKNDPTEVDFVFKISSDALAQGLSVLTQESASTEDLEKVFSTFADKVELVSKKVISRLGDSIDFDDVDDDENL